MRLKLSLLGPLIITINDKAIALSRTKKIEALLIFLALEPEHPHRRENLVGLLFPDLPDEQARTNLRQTMTRLRRAVNNEQADLPFIWFSRESAQFNLESDHDLDTAEFERLLNGCPSHFSDVDEDCQACMTKAQQAVVLYRGPLLDDFYLEDSAAFEEWSLTRREHFQERVLTTLQQLTRYHERRGNYQLAEQFARRQITIEPWREEAYQQLMRTLTYQGRRNTALLQYKKLQTILEKELGVEPLPETIALRQRIALAGQQRPFILPARDSTFIGREAEIATIHNYLNDNDRRLITLTGPGGSGKTALAIEIGWRVATNHIGPFMHGVFFVPMPLATPEKGEDNQSLNLITIAIAEVLGFQFAGSNNPQTQLLRYLKDKSILLILDNMDHLVESARLFVQKLLLQTDYVNFDGSFDWQAAQIVTGATRQQLEGLVDRSLVQRQIITQSSQPRFAMLTTLRRYAADKLVLSTIEHQQVEYNYTHYYTKFLADREQALEGTGQQKALQEIMAEISNIRSAWIKAIRVGEEAMLAESLSALALVLYMRSWFSEGEEIFSLAKDKMAEGPHTTDRAILWARLAARTGWFAFLSGNEQRGESFMQQSLTLLRQQNNRKALVFSLYYLTVISYSVGDYNKACHLVEEGIELSEKAADRNDMAVGYNIYSQISLLQGEYEDARHFGEKSLILARELGNLWSSGFSLMNVGRSDHLLGHYQNAESYYYEAMNIRQAFSDKRGKAQCLLYLGDLALDQKNRKKGLEYYNQSQTIYEEIGYREGVTSIYLRLGHDALNHAQRAEGNKFFHMALRLASEEQALPLILESIIGLAEIMETTNPDKAHQISHLVSRHAAATQDVRGRAGMLLHTFNPTREQEDLIPYLPEDEKALLDKLTAELLSLPE